MTTRYHIASTAVRLLPRILASTEPWSVANAVLRPLINEKVFTPYEVEKVEAFLWTHRTSNTAADAPRLHEGARGLLRDIQPNTLAD